jgi:hypothetical protein
MPAAEKNAYKFSSFSLSFFTLFQLLTLDQWFDIETARPLLHHIQGGGRGSVPQGFLRHTAVNLCSHRHEMGCPTRPGCPREGTRLTRGMFLWVAAVLPTVRRRKPRRVPHLLHRMGLDRERAPMRPRSFVRAFFRVRVRSCARSFVRARTNERTRLSHRVGVDRERAAESNL